MKKIFVVLINYKNAKLTIECIRSIYETKDEVNIIVVDNDSQDDSVKIIQNNFNTIKVIELEKNIGFSGGNNIGIKYALNHGADVVMLLNNDTIVSKNLIKQFLKYDNDETVLVPKIYYHDTNKIWYAGGEINRISGNAIHYGNNKTDEKKFNKNKIVSFATGCCIWIPKRVFEKIGFMKEEYFLYFEDVEYSLRMKFNNIKIMYIYSANVWHKVSSSSGGSDSALCNYYITRNRLQCIDQYHNYFCKITLFYSKATRYIRMFQKIIKGDVRWKSIRKGIKDYKAGVKGKVNDIT